MDRALQIAFKDTQPSEALETLIRERAERMEKVHHHIIGCRVVVEVPHRAAETFKPPLGIAVEVDIPGRPMIVAKDEQERHEAKSDTFAMVNRAFEAVERQLGHAKDIRHRKVKQHEDTGETGLVVRLFPEQSYGFVEVRGSGELYFTRNAVADDAFDALDVGTMVEITRADGEGPMGPQASSVKILNARRSPE